MKKQNIVVARHIDGRVARIARHYGLGPQLAKTCEELRELYMAILKQRLAKWLGRNTKALDQHVLEEIADVRIMLDQIELLMSGANTCARIRSAKLDRQISRITTAKENI